ncbi:hypothetical protein G7Y79_00013g033930 [Physcia stellaris]|nr:hypothetical protein G7Y79_00013g033930 [Physcia stellaris]
MILLQALEDRGQPIDYYALDLSEPELRRSLEQIPPGMFKHVKCHGLLGTFEDGQRWLKRAENVHRPKCVVSLGSTIGSCSRSDAGKFLLGLVQSLNEQRVFGAYNDSDGLNAAFILNVLDHANAVLGYDAFDRSEWTVCGEWNKVKGSHDQYLVPQKDVIFEGAILKAQTRILVVSSLKYDSKQRAQLWDRAMCVEFKRWSIQEGSYSIHMLAPLSFLD